MEDALRLRTSAGGNRAVAASTVGLTQDRPRYPRSPRSAELGCLQCAAVPIPVLLDRDSMIAARLIHIRKNLECAWACDSLRGCRAECVVGRRTSGDDRTRLEFAPEARESETSVQLLGC